MKEIKLLIDDKVHDDLVQALFVHKLAIGHSGVTDQAINKILKAIKQGDEEVTLQYKEY
jgi:hypothetical protein|tara:strand:- start:854 stop:1030 length:177 start_codon:yes stop_codon:yes gene_type:complete